MPSHDCPVCVYVFAWVLLCPVHEGIETGSWSDGMTETLSDGLCWLWPFHSVDIERPRWGEKDR